MPKCASNNRDVFLNVTLAACFFFRVCLLLGSPFSPPRHPFSNSWCYCNTAGSLAPMIRNSPHRSPEPPNPQRPKKSQHIVKTKLAPEFVHFFKQRDTSCGTNISFLTVLCVWLLLKSTCARTRVSHRGVCGTLRAFFSLCTSIRGRQTTTRNHKTRVQVAVATCVQDMGTRRKTSLPTVTVGAKRLNKGKRRLINLRQRLGVPVQPRQRCTVSQHLAVLQGIPRFGLPCPSCAL